MSESVAGVPGARRADVAYAWLKERLLSGAYSFGNELSIVEVARETGMSRQPVMDAVKRLQLEGFVDIIPQVGCRIPVPSVRSVRDLFEVFATLEGLVTRLAAERRDPEVAASALTGAHAFPGVSAGDFDVARYRVLNRRFHAAIHALAESAETRRAAETYWDRSDFLIATAGGEHWAAHLDVSDTEHAELAELVIAGKAEEAGARAYEHIRQFGEVALEGLRSHVSGAPVATAAAPS